MSCATHAAGAATDDALAANVAGPSARPAQAYDPFDDPFSSQRPAGSDRDPFAGPPEPVELLN